MRYRQQEITGLKPSTFLSEAGKSTMSNYDPLLNDSRSSDDIRRYNG